MEEIVEYAPVIIPTLNRYEHFKRCVESLAKCTHANKTELIIGLDYPPSEKYIDGWTKICNYIDSIQGFKNVTVFKATHNLGQGANTRVCMDYVFKYYNTFILSEDDNEFSPCFLDYENKALTKYWNNDKVSAIVGYCYPIAIENYSKNVFFYHDQSAWGIGRWKHKYQTYEKDYAQNVFRSLRKVIKLYIRDTRLFYVILSMMSKKAIWGDAINSLKNIIDDKVVLYPTISMCRNHGHDGSGLHCGNSGRSNIYINQSILECKEFSPDNIDICESNIKEIETYFKMPIVERLSVIKHFLISKI